MSVRADKAEKKTQVLTSALSAQDEIINECYIKIGTRKQLVASSLLKGKFLQKKIYHLTVIALHTTRILCLVKLSAGFICP